jgi:hypothetical protein
MLNQIDLLSAFSGKDDFNNLDRLCQIHFLRQGEQGPQFTYSCFYLMLQDNKIGIEFYQHITRVVKVVQVPKEYKGVVVIYGNGGPVDESKDIRISVPLYPTYLPELHFRIPVKEWFETIRDIMTSINKQPGQFATNIYMRTLPEIFEDKVICVFGGMKIPFLYEE